MHDVVIAGAGPVGLSAALALTRQGMHVLVLDAQPQVGGADPRVFALSYGARLILERLNVWSDLAAAAPIHAVHVSQRGRFGHTVLKAEELELDALGYVVGHAELMQALRRGLAAAGIDRISGARVLAVEEQAQAAMVRFEHARSEQQASALVVVQADGGASPAGATHSTEREYGQCAVVAEVDCERAICDWAYERFTGRGPIALLPFRGHHALIWTVPEADAEALLALEQTALERALAQSYGERIGAVRLLGRRASFRLLLRYAHRVAGERQVLIGNAAQTLHPVAGQGFNLGLRDAFELAQVLAECSQRNQDLLLGVRRYRSRRRLDRAGGTLFTDFLVRVFSNDDPLLAAGRSAGLFLLDASGPAKRFLMRRMIFGSPG